MERCRERDSATDAKRTRGGHVSSDAKLDKIGKRFDKYPRKFWGQFHRKKIPSRI